MGGEHQALAGDVRVRLRPDAPASKRGNERDETDVKNEPSA